ncbi:MAG: L-dopachrome tautomerase-related protein [Ignavibacteria bacterium]|jgi:sugar lactone lactonase YvrE
MNYIFNNLKVKPLLVFLVLSLNTFFGQGNTVQLTEVASSEFRWTGVAVSHEGRMFVNFPRWSQIPFSVCEVIDGQPVQYPDEEWNTWNETTDPENHFVCIQSVYVDRENFLWILDPGTVNWKVVEGGAKLLKVDLQTDSIIQIIYFNESIASGQSYLNDVRVDTELGYAYITDSGIGAIVVVNLLNGESRKLLDQHSSTKAEQSTITVNGRSVEFTVHSDGLALSNNREYLYYKALSGKSLFRIKTGVLRDFSLSPTKIGEAAEFVIETMPCDAIEFAPDDYLYITSVEDNAIYRYLPDEKLELVIRDEKLTWPDSFAITPDGKIYVTTSRIMFPPGLHAVFLIE